MLEQRLRDLRAALLTFDEPGANAALDRLLASLSLEAFLQEVVLPVMRDLGESWFRGEATIAQEHFASNLLRGRLLALGRGWGRGTGPHALLAAPPGEQHDLGLIVLGLALRDRGWRVTFLGADTPIETAMDTARRIAPEVVVFAALVSSRFRPVLAAIEELARNRHVVLSGAGVTTDLAVRVGAEYMPQGPIEAADHLTSTVAVGRSQPSLA